MNSNIKKILEDLYAVDQNLRPYEKDLEKIILKILDLKPQAEFDESFRLELRTRLLAEAERLKQAQPVYGAPHQTLPTVRGESLSSVWGLFTRKYAFVGVLGSILILVAAGWFANKQGVLNLKPKPEPQSIAFQKTELKDNAFGSLFGQQDGQAVSQDLSAGFGRGGGAPDQSAAQGLGGSALAPAAPQPQSLAAPEKMSLGFGDGGGGVAISGSTGIADPGMPVFIPEYKFVYKGGDFDLPGDSVEVLRRKTGFDGLGGLENLLNTLGMGLADLSSFGSLKLQNLNLVDDRDLGYSINIDFLSATVGISENADWRGLYADSRGNIEPLKVSDIPSDEKLIEIANNFLRDHGISTQNYSQPEIDNNFRIGILEQTKAGVGTDIASYPYVQEAIQVIYPLQINGQTVFDEGGNITGLSVSVNIRTMRVSGLWNLTTQNYEASMYQAQTDKAEIIKAAENGGVWGPRYYADNSRAVDVELGTPQLGYSTVWNYQKSQSSQLLVPALIFPITKVPSEIQYFYQKNIVIPLAKEFFDRNNDIPVPLPMEIKPVN